MPTSPCVVRPPIFSSRTVVAGVFCSSSAYFVLTMNLSPVKRSGQWQCSQVSREGRRLRTGEGIGREYVFRFTAKSCRTPEILARTNQGAPEPMWQSTQETRECGEFRYAVYSGAMTE